MQRPQQQVTNAAGRNLMRPVFESLGWAVREIPQDTDIGIDFEVEVFENRTSTGTIFKVQLKSSTQSDYSRKADTVKEYVKRKHLTYYCKELSDPVIVIHADIKSNRLFWLAPQLAVFPAKWLDGSEPDRRAALLIPTCNELPNSLNDLVRTIGRIKLVAGTRVVLETSIPQFLASIKEHVNEDELIREFRDKSDAVRLSQINQLYQRREFDSATDRIDSIITSSDSSVENRFWALLERERIEYRVSAESGKTPQGALGEIHLKCAKDLQRITKGGPPALKFVALIHRKTAELDILACKAVGLAMNHRNLVANESGYWALRATTRD